MKSDLHDIDVIFQHQTEKAVCVRLTEDGSDIWVPLGLCEIAPREGSALRRGKPAVLTSDETTLTEKGLV